MMENSNLIVMLTHNDYTVNNAREVFEDCKCSQTKLWGMKEHSLAFPEMKALFLDMKNLGMTTFLEVIGYTEEEGLAGAEMAIECRCDYLLGTTFSESVLELCLNNGIRYMPFVGSVIQRPSVLEGSIESMIDDAKRYVGKGAYGIDLLGFRYVGDSTELIMQIIDSVHAPVCLAGSIDDFNKLDIVKVAKPMFFTIGSAFFEKKFGRTILSQINKVCDYVGKNNEVVDYYNHIANQYDEDRFMNSYGRFIDRAERKIMDSLVPDSVKEDKNILEVACGTGRLTNYATHGLDASYAMMDFARKKHPDVEFKLASATDTGYDAEMFDMVYSFHLLMHLSADTIQDMFDEVYRILKQNGTFIFDVPSRKRRQLLHHKQANWHGGTELSCEDIVSLCGDKYIVRKSFGLLMLPVHAFPSFMRKYMNSLDFLLSNSWLREYSSYLVYELIKK